MWSPRLTQSPRPRLRRSAHLKTPPSLYWVSSPRRQPFQLKPSLWSLRLNYRQSSARTWRQQALCLSPNPFQLCNLLLVRYVSYGWPFLLKVWFTPLLNLVQSSITAAATSITTSTTTPPAVTLTSTSVTTAAGSTITTTVTPTAVVQKRDQGFSQAVPLAPRAHAIDRRGGFPQTAYCLVRNMRPLLCRFPFFTRDAHSLADRNLRSDCVNAHDGYGKL